MSNLNPTIYDIALTLCEGVGVRKYPILRERFSNSKEILDLSESDLKSFGFPDSTVSDIKSGAILGKAVEEWEFTQRHKISVMTVGSDAYSNKLRECCDAPWLLYGKGNFNFNEMIVISVVGTRRATAYGIKFCEALMQEIAQCNYPIVIVSGLAYGVDIAAHRAAMRCGVPTVAILAHGLDQIYPSRHRADVIEMINRGGGVATEFHSKSVITKGNFVRRNRIVAGLADAVIVVESAQKGGALITADMALSYDREVLALPGRITDKNSVGCNALIKSCSAHPISDFGDIESALGLGYQSYYLENPKAPELEPLEAKIYALLEQNGDLSIDSIATGLRLSVDQLYSILLELELKGQIKRGSGGVYRI